MLLVYKWLCYVYVLYYVSSNKQKKKDRIENFLFAFLSINICVLWDQTFVWQA